MNDKQAGKFMLKKEDYIYIYWEIFSAQISTFLTQAWPYVRSLF